MFYNVRVGLRRMSSLPMSATKPLPPSLGGVDALFQEWTCQPVTLRQRQEMAEFNQSVS